VCDVLPPPPGTTFQREARRARLHFEELGNNEVAEVLGISKDAASKRHVRALMRLRDILAGTPGAGPV